MSTTTFGITGMTCGHCVASVTDALQGVDGVDSVEITLVPQRVSQATITTARDVPGAQFEASVRGEGYEVVWA